MTVKKFLNWLKPNNPFKVAFVGTEAKFGSAEELPESILNAELIRTSKDNDGCVVLEVKE